MIVYLEPTHLGVEAFSSTQFAVHSSQKIVHAVHDRRRDARYAAAVVAGGGLPDVHRGRAHGGWLLGSAPVEPAQRGGLVGGVRAAGAHRGERVRAERLVRKWLAHTTAVASRAPCMWSRPRCAIQCLRCALYNRGADAARLSSCSAHRARREWGALWPRMPAELFVVYSWVNKWTCVGFRIFRIAAAALVTHD